jgi:Sulfotransferase domain
MLTGRLRIAPDFVIIGAQRCGTTSLYNNLKKHLYIVPALKKEVHFFDINFNKGADWYRAHFPSYIYKYTKRIGGQNFITGEASPYYIFHPHAPKRVAELLPQIKLIALLRNPVDRAYSHYHHEVRIGYETLSFEEAIAREKERLLAEATKMQEDEDYCSFNHRHYSYLSRGIYIDQLKNWMQFFPSEQVLILKSEDFYNDPPTVVARVLEFLGLPNCRIENSGKYNYHPYSKMDTTVRKDLIAYFEPLNQALYDYLNVDFGWNR